MSEGIPYADIVILALIAGFILLRLRSVLGTKVGNDNPDYFKKILPKAGQNEPVVQIDEKSLKAKVAAPADPYLATVTDEQILKNIADIKARDPQFSATAFMHGAKMAFEMVFDAFTKGDRQTLKMLLSDTIFQQFNAEIDERETQENRTETTLVSVTAKGIVAAELKYNVARVSVHFENEQVSVVRSSKGDIVEGDPSELHRADTEWVFERDITSKNPNWKIIET